MYLNNLFIENMGSIEKLQILEKDLFLENGNPKPIILLGKNGSGKTTLLSSIADAFLELGNKSFNNILPRNGNWLHKYYKVSGGINTKLGKKYSYTYLQYKNNEKIYEYIDKNGELKYDECKEKTNNILSLNSGDWKNDTNYKNVTDISKDDIFLGDFENNTYCYFPSDRFEFPHWLIRDTDKYIYNFTNKQKYKGDLGKQIIVKNSLDEIKNWILDLFLDSRTGIIQNQDGTYSPIQNINAINYLQQGIKNIENILSQIIGNNIRIDTNLRSHSLSRIKITNKETNEDIIPTLDNLSAGESILLGMFGTIIKNSDLADVNKSIKLEDIEGIVVIDEIDLHLHIRLQKEVLPKLIKLFPKVQFIISTHSPFFLYGMNKEFGDDVLMLNMPSGIQITDYGKFNEFEEAYEVFDDLTQDYQKKYEELNEEIKKQNKPIVFVEGPSDVEYIKQAYKLFKKKMNFKLDIIGSNSKGGTKNSNNEALKRAETFLKSKNYLVKQKIILLNDPEENREESDYGNLFVRIMKKFERKKINKGIENLFSDDFINKVEKNNPDLFGYFKKGREKVDYKILDGKKSKVCKWICENGTKEDFKNFETIINTIDEIINTNPI